MKRVRRHLSLATSCMLTLTLLITIPVQPLLAAMIPTEASVDTVAADRARSNLKTLLAREDVRQALVDQGIDPAEATARIDGLTDAEAVAVAGRLDNLPAGGSALGVIVGALLIVFLVLLITDIMGYTDIFPFVKARTKSDG